MLMMHRQWFQSFYQLKTIWTLRSKMRGRHHGLLLMRTNEPSSADKEIEMFIDSTFLLKKRLRRSTLTSSHKTTSRLLVAPFRAGFSRTRRWAKPRITLSTTPLLGTFLKRQFLKRTITDGSRRPFTRRTGSQKKTTTWWEASLS